MILKDIGEKVNQHKNVSTFTQLNLFSKFICLCKLLQNNKFRLEIQQKEWGKYYS